MNQWVGSINRSIQNIYKTCKFRSKSIIVYTKYKCDTKSHKKATFLIFAVFLTKCRVISTPHVQNIFKLYVPKNLINFKQY